jgi:hypothetical protein
MVHECVERPPRGLFARAPRGPLRVAFFTVLPVQCKSSQVQKSASRLSCATLLRTMATSARSDAAWEYRA